MCDLDVQEELDLFLQNRDGMDVYAGVLIDLISKHAGHVLGRDGGVATHSLLVQYSTIRPVVS